MIQIQCTRHTGNRDQQQWQHCNNWFYSNSWLTTAHNNSSQQHLAHHGNNWLTTTAHSNTWLTTPASGSRSGSRNVFEDAEQMEGSRLRAPLPLPLHIHDYAVKVCVTVKQTQRPWLGQSRLRTRPVRIDGACPTPSCTRAERGAVAGTKKALGD